MKLDDRTIRLIAVGASVSANCQPCLEVNITKALQNGSDEQEIAAAIEVGKLVRNGAASKMEKFISIKYRASSLYADESTEECGCSS